MWIAIWKTSAGLRAGPGGPSFGPAAGPERVFECEMRSRGPVFPPPQRAKGSLAKVDLSASATPPLP
ncbi:mCG1040288 [Mus musculus]|nr:mCG1040288 [Mus musculus]